MGKREIRTSQLIRPFGPGSIYIDSKGIPLIIPNEPLKIT